MLKLKEELDSADIYIDSTSCGMKPLEDVVAIPDKSYLRPDLVVMDTVYAPRQTKLMKWCDEVGCKNFNGLGMMLYQALLRSNSGLAKKCLSTSSKTSYSNPRRLCSTMVTIGNVALNNGTP